MARLRTIKPEFFSNDALAECAPLARLLFIGLWTVADRQGRLEDRPKRLKATVLPYDECDVNELLDQLAKRGFILRYTVDEASFIQICTWSKDQNPHVKEPESTLPAPCKHSAALVQERGDAAYRLEQAELIPASLIPNPASLSPPDPGVPQKKKRDFGLAGKPNLPACRTDKVVDAYHAALPDLPRVKLMTDGRRRAISRFWNWIFSTTKKDGTPRACTAEEALAWARDYFNCANDNDFLMGRGPKSVGHEKWRCSFDFLLTDKGKVQVIEMTGGAS